MTTTSNGGEWSYSGDPSTSKRDEVRFLMQDTDEALPLISNAELDYLLDFYAPRFDDSALYVAAKASLVVSRRFAGVVSVTADGVTVQVGDLSARYEAIAAQLLRDHHGAASVGGAVDLENLMWDAELDAMIAPLDFSVGMHDNPAAGGQNLGGHASGPTWDNDTRRWA